MKWKSMKKFCQFSQSGGGLGGKVRKGLVEKVKLKWGFERSVSGLHIDRGFTWNKCK